MPKPFTRKWIRSNKKGMRGHFSHCMKGHPWAGEGPCVACRTKRDALRHARPDVKEADAKRKRVGRWGVGEGIKRESLGDGVTAEFWRGRVRLSNGSEAMILESMHAMRLCLALCDLVELTPPSKLPKGVRQIARGKNA